LKRRIVVRPEARAELAEAVGWYRGKSEVVAGGFRVSVRQTIAHISERPKSFVEILPGVRRALTSQYPYAIFYAEENDAIIVLSAKSLR
jgi:plasmid stabilization system protein ParE